MADLIPIKLVMITDQPPWTGIGRYCWELSELMHKFGVNSKLIYNGYKTIGNIYPKGDYEMPAFVKTCNNTYLIPIYRKINGWNLRNLVDKFKDHIVHFCGSDYSSVALFSNSVVTIHDLRRDLQINGIRNFLDSIYRDVINIKALHDIKFAKSIVSISYVVQKELQYYGITSNVIHHWINNDKFHWRSMDESRKTLSLPKDLFLILNVSNSTANKRLYFLKKIADFLPKGYKIIKIGAPIRNDNIINVGYVSEDMYPYFFNAANLYIHTSTYEGFGRPLIEALGSELPIIAQDNPINREILKENAVYYEDSTSANEVANKIVELIKGIDYDKFSKNIQNLKEEYSEIRAFKEYTNLYKDIDLHRK
ncbi:MAG: glycosyltransferase family 4 protein [Candidatus Micrarchaeaceae archaeon]